MSIKTSKWNFITIENPNAKLNNFLNQFKILNMKKIFAKPNKAILTKNKFTLMIFQFKITSFKDFHQ